MAELLTVWVKQDLHKTHSGLAEAVHSYRAGYLPKERRKIEKGLKQRTISGVVTTNALELGIDIGSLDCVIMSGYPGTVISTWQQAGRAGRLIDDSVVFLVAFQNPLDQYFMNHPQDFFRRNPENAVINLDNPYITAGHIMCASKEIPITEKDKEYFTEGYDQTLSILLKNRLFKKGHFGWEYSGPSRPELRARAPTAYLVAPANENEKRHFKEVASRAKERFPNAKWHVADNQYSSKRLRRYIEEDLKGSPVIPKKRNEKRGSGDFYVDKTFRCRGDRRMCRLYWRRTASERMNSRAERLIGRNTLRGLSKVGSYVGVALTLMLLIAAASYRNGKPQLARSIEYYASH